MGRNRLQHVPHQHPLRNTAGPATELAEQHPVGFGLLVGKDGVDRGLDHGAASYGPWAKPARIGAAIMPARTAECQ